MSAPPEKRFSTLIRNGKIADGTGNPWFYGDLAFAGGTIAAVAPPGRLSTEDADEIVDATNRVVAPGFIDIQSHSIVPFLTDRRSLSKITQGVTTEIMGEAWTPSPYGGRIDEPFEPGIRNRVGPSFDEWQERARGWSRFGDWLADLESRGVSVNVGSFMGASTVREYAMAYDLGEANAEQLETMRRVLAEAMEDGAFGLATALIYPPGSFAGTAELIELCKVVAAYNGIHITHIRSEGDLLLESLEEAIEIAEATGVITEIYHLKAAGRENWGKMPEAIARIDAARAAGIDITADMYPYEGAGTGLAACVPPWAFADGKLFDNLRDPSLRERITREMADPDEPWENLGRLAGPEGVLVLSMEHPDLKRYEHRFIGDIAAERGQDWTEAIVDLLATEGHNIFTVFIAMDAENLKLQLCQPWIKISTDAGGIDPEIAKPLGLTHPRAYGTYTRVLGKYVREEQVIPLEDAVRKMSSAVADRLGLRDRGLIRVGMKADVIAFDPETVADRATFADPHQRSVGIENVWVNGARVLRNGTHTGVFPGQRVYGPGAIGPYLKAQS
jgi:dihydroorotase/N-acyl-D-amino-acid deacylase